MAKLLRQRSLTAWAGLTGEHKHTDERAFLESESAAVTAGSDWLASGKRATTLAIMQYWLNPMQSSRSK